MAVYSSRQSHLSKVGGKQRSSVTPYGVSGGERRVGYLRKLAPTRVFQRFGLALIDGLDAVPGELPLEPPQSERRKHQQPGDAGHQQP
jgi:hypothetical protein